MLWVMHRFAEAFDDHAVIKGGMALRLLDSPRHTNDLDYTFVPYDSKKEVAPIVTSILDELEGAVVHTILHSTMIRTEVQLDAAVIQIEISVAARCDSVAVATAPLASGQALPSRIVRIMAPDVALAHKLAAWNERRLTRDLYDAYFLVARARATPSLEVLQARLAQIRSRLPQLRSRRRMTLQQLVTEMVSALDELSDARLTEELHGLIDEAELPGLALRIQTTLRRLIDQLKAQER